MASQRSCDYSFYILLIGTMILLVNVLLPIGKVEREFHERKQRKTLIDLSKSNPTLHLQTLRKNRALMTARYAPKKFLTRLYTSFFLILLSYIFFLTALFAVTKLNMDFAQRSAVLAPVIDEQTEEIFMSKWSKMKSKDDYNLINHQMDSLAKANKIKLPEAF